MDAYVRWKPAAQLFGDLARTLAVAKQLVNDFGHAKRVPSYQQVPDSPDAADLYATQ